MAEPARAVAVVVNGAAGALLERADAEGELAALFRDAGLEPRFVPSDSGPLPERIVAAIAMGTEAVVVAGGDGTIACAAQALTGTGMALGILPFGTMNLLAKDLGLPIGDVAAAVRALADGAPRDIDVAEVNGHVFACASMLGLPARIGRHREVARASGTLLGRALRLGVAVVRSLRRHGQPGLVLSLPDARIRSHAVSVTVTVNALAEADGPLFGRPRLDAGELAVHVIERLRLPDMLRLVHGLLRGRWRRSGVVRELRTTQLDVHARRRALRIMNDGEGLVLAPPLRYRLRPGALRVLAPRVDPDA